MKERDLEQRVATLERHNRILTYTLASLLLLGCVAAIADQEEASQRPDGHFRIVSASKFELRDPRTNTIRADLAHQVAPGGWAGLHFYDNDGQPRAWIKVFEDGEASFALLDSDWNIQSLIGIDNNGRASFATNQNERWVYIDEMKRKGVKLDYLDR